MKGFPDKVYLNGEIIDSVTAKISVFDRGFIFGDGIYEAMVQINGRFFYEDAHLKRLDYCLKQIQIDFNVDRLKSEIPKLLAASGLTNKDCFLYIQITRGIAPRKHGFPTDVTPTVLMYAVAKTLPEINDLHMETVSMKDFRWERCDIKMTSLLGNIMANEFAMQNNCYETILVRDGVVTEASHCNVFFVKDDIVYTHPANEHILNGITRQIVLEMCDNLNIKVIEEGILFNSIAAMDEAFLTGTSTQIAAIKRIDGHYFYTNNNIGPVTRRLQEAYRVLKL